MHIAEVVTIAKSLPLLRLNTYKSLILSYSADYRRILWKKCSVRKRKRNKKMRVCHQQDDDTPSTVFQCCVQLRMEDRQRFHLLQELLAELEGMEQ